MKLALSNLALPIPVEDAFLSELAESGVGGLEVALTRIRPWEALSPAVVSDYRAKLSDLGLQVPSLQAISFGIDSAALLGSNTAFDLLRERLKQVTEYGALLGARVAVFGAPKVRQMDGLSAAAAMSIGAPRIAELADICGAHDICLAMEPVPSAYGGDYLARWQDIATLARMLDHSHFGLHLDIGCVTLGGGDIEEAIEQTRDVIRHYHIAERDLRDFADPEMPHDIAAVALHRSGYQGWLSIEMACQQDDPLAAVRTAVRFARNVYDNSIDPDAVT